MKTLLSIFILSTLFSCAHQPQRPAVWEDEYGIIHKSSVTPAEISPVIVTREEIPVGCKRLRNIYLKGTAYKEWQLKTEGAKQGATHVKQEYINGLQDTLGIAYDCANFRIVQNQLQRNRLIMQHKAMAEMERRRAARGQSYQLTPVKDGAFNDRQPSGNTQRYGKNGLPLYEYTGDR